MATRKPKTKAPYTTENNNGNIAELLDELFQAAIKLRGSIEPSDYKRYVLPIVFLRFLSLRFERRRAELTRLVAEPKSEYYQLEYVIDDPDEYSNVGAFILPAEARWENIRRNAQADDIKVRLDNILELLENTYPDTKGLLPRIYAGSNLARESVTGLINLFSKDVFERDYGSEDLIGRVYQYFIGEFASSEGKRGGEYFTPASIVRLLVAMLEPESGVVLDPCCGSGGMFVQSDLFTHHSRKLTFYGQESKDFTYRLCRMNLFIHGLNSDIQLGNSYTDDKHDTLRADYVLANPPFNDGSKGDDGWGAQNVPANDPRLRLGAEKMSLAARNANTMWMLHFLYHLAEGGTAGFVMANGELSSSETARLEVRRALIENNTVDCIVQLSGQLFANTQIPCTLWFLSKNRNGQKGYRQRRDEILFIDGRGLGKLMDGSRKQKELSEADLEQIAAVYRQFKRSGRPAAVPGFCRAATLEEVRAQGYVLTPGRYVGSAEVEEDDEPFAEKLARLTRELEGQFASGNELQVRIRENLKGIGYEF